MRCKMDMGPLKRLGYSRAHRSPFLASGHFSPLRGCALPDPLLYSIAKACISHNVLSAFRQQADALHAQNDPG